VLGHLVLADDGTGLKRDLGGAAQWPLGAANPVLDFEQVALRCGEQILALAAARDGVCRWPERSNTRSVTASYRASSS
jgi:hypothetical protein